MNAKFFIQILAGVLLLLALGGCVSNQIRHNQLILLNKGMESAQV